MTTKIAGRPYDGMLSEKGFRGFPSLAFMDAEGNVLARQADRTVAGFRTTFAAVQTHQDLKARMAKGEKNLEFPMLLAEWDLGTLDWEALKQRAGQLPKLAKADQAKLDQMLLDAEVLHMSGAIRDEAAMVAAGKRFLELLGANYAPGPRAEMNFWSVLLRYADMQEDADTYERAANFMKARFGKDPNMAEAVKSLDERLAELRSAGAKQP